MLIVEICWARFGMRGRSPKGSGKALRGSKEDEKRDTGNSLVIGNDRSMKVVSGAYRLEECENQSATG